MWNGLIIIKKEKGFTSFDVVAKLRGICGQKKIGHTGTLDPDAEGVLPVCLGNATKVCDMLTDSDKEYEAVMLLGKTTDTQDTSGAVLSEQAVNVTEQQVREVIASFTGTQQQLPPMYSALKVNGRKLCDLAREGKSVERKTRPITVYEIQVLEVDLPRVRMRVACSKGTYIRTLCHDMGEQLGCGGCMEALMRTKAAGFSLADAHLLSEVQQAKDQGQLSELIAPTESVFLNYGIIQVQPVFDLLLQNGNRLLPEQLLEMPKETNGETPFRVHDSKGTFQAIYAWDEKHSDFKPLKMFLE